jgi:hypothetical protein
MHTANGRQATRICEGDCMRGYFVSIRSCCVFLGRVSGFSQGSFEESVGLSVKSGFALETVSKEPYAHQ